MNREDKWLTKDLKKPKIKPDKFGYIYGLDVIIEETERFNEVVKKYSITGDINDVYAYFKRFEGKEVKE